MGAGMAVEGGVGPVLRAAGLTREVSSPEGTLTILDDVSLSVHAGDSLAIVGASGSGKTTLLSLLAGLDLPTRGGVWLGDEEITAMDEDGRARVRGQRVGFVFQSFQLLSSFTALENVMLPLELAGRADARAASIDALALVGLTDRATHLPSQLSGGEQQRVALARAFVTRPVLLLADEPTGSLDTRTGERVIQQLFSMNASAGTTLVMVTHDAELASRCARVATMDAGRLVET
jgi:putative ABC transport system ATP-binding protein